MLAEGKQTFRFDTFGSEAFWGDTLKLHEAVAKLSPKQALALGLKVDANALPADLVEQLKQGKVNLDDPATTLALLKFKAVVGVTGFSREDGTLRSVGISCALCHSTVDDSFAPGIGHRLDGWPNRDLNVGGIIVSAPDLSTFQKLLGISEPTVRKVLRSWGPGKFDAELTLDGKAFRPDGKTAAVLIPAAFGLAGVSNHTWTGAWGNVTYWNAFVANLEMHGKGTFFDPRLDDKKYPVAAKAGLGHKHDGEDLISAKLAALHFYQLAMPAPPPPPNSFNNERAARGEKIFNTKAKCATCHVPPLFTEPGWNLHSAEEIGIDDFQAKRAPDNRYRTAPLRAVFDTQKIHKGGFYHDGRFATLPDVVNHYDSVLKLRLTEQEKNDLIEYLKSI
jgi:Di-haem oxidoreductase, putative peroxidase